MWNAITFACPWYLYLAHKSLIFQIVDPQCTAIDNVRNVLLDT